MKTKHRFNCTWFLIGGFLALTSVFWLVIGDRAQLAIADNLDLFQPQYEMLRRTHTFFAHGASVPFLHGITRDVLPSELSLTTLLYVFLPPLAAYLVNWTLKAVIAVIGFSLVYREFTLRGLLPGDHEGLALVCGLTYGLLPLFPNFGICFASIPLLLVWVMRLDLAQGRKKAACYLLLIFCYPFVSYFSYFGLFLIGYLFLAFLVVSVYRRRFDGRLFLAVLALSAGSAVFEYRLFGTMLFPESGSIRSSMVIAAMTPAQVFAQMKYAFLTGAAMHSQTLHRFVVLPVTAFFFLAVNLRSIFRKEPGRILREPLNGIFLLLVFNSAVYGAYYLAPFREAVGRLLPPLNGFQFNRTVFFNGFLWYGAFAIVLIRMAEYLEGHVIQRKGKRFYRRGSLAARFAAPALAAAALAVVLLAPLPYNDLYSSVKAGVKHLLGRGPEETLNYGEFYSTELFDRIRNDIGYQGEWCVAYGFYPAILEYNGFATLDGYLGFYSQEYKDAFRKGIAPALEMNEGSRQYFDSWGARCYVYSGVSPTVVEPVRHYPHGQEPIAIDPDAFRALDLTYVISRIELTNADECDLEPAGVYEDASSPYRVYVYRLK